VIEVKAEEEPLEVKMNSPRPGTKAEAALAMLRKGKTQKEIAAELGVSLGFIYKLGKRYL
jgi:transposase